MTLGLALSTKQLQVIDKHFKAYPPGDSLTRVNQWEGVSSVYNPNTGRLHAYRHNKRKSGKQELVFESLDSICSTVVGCASHTVKLWDLRRTVTARELARIQGFPEHFTLPATCAHNLFGNAVAVPVAAHACSRVLPDSNAAVRFIDVCAGIGGFHFGIKQVCPNAQCVGFSEIKPSAIKCYTANFGSTPALGDASTATWPEAHMVVAGFPCQPFSRSQNTVRPQAHPAYGFFRSLLRCLHESGAHAFAFENVSALLSTGKEVFNELKTELQSMGYHVKHAILDAKWYGVPQTRKRVFLVGSKLQEPRDFEMNTTLPPVTLRSIIDV